MEYENMSAREISELAEPLTDEVLQTVNELYIPYMFYRNHKSGVKECYCSSCRTHYGFELGRTSCEFDVELFNARHNDIAVCPYCGAKAKAKQIGTIKTGASLWEEVRFVVPQIVDFDTVIFACYYSHKSYRYAESETMRFCSLPKYNLHNVYVLRRGKKSIEARLYGYCDYILGAEWKLVRTVTEPFTKYMSGYADYHLLNEDVLDKSFLRYTPIADFADCTRSSYRDILTMSMFSCYSEYPGTEVLLKHGISEPVEALIRRRTPNKRLIDWQAKTPWDILRLSKSEYKALQNEKTLCRKLILLEVYRLCKKIYKKADITKVNRLLVVGDGAYHYLRIEDIIRKYKPNITRLIHYFEKIGGHIQEYFDYIRMAEVLGYDLNNDVVLFPKNVKKAHDKTNAEHSVFLQQKKIENLEIQKSKVKKYVGKYAYTDGVYSIILPKAPEDIITEGAIQRHCVGGYLERHYNGTCCICFLRKAAEPEKPFYTIEMRGEKCIQIHGYQNCNIEIDKKAEEFFNKWLEWVKAGSPKNKKAIA